MKNRVKEYLGKYTNIGIFIEINLVGGANYNLIEVEGISILVLNLIGLNEAKRGWGRSIMKKLKIISRVIVSWVDLQATKFF